MGGRLEGTIVVLVVVELVVAAPVVAAPAATPKVANSAAAPNHTAHLCNTTPMRGFVDRSRDHLNRSSLPTQQNKRPTLDHQGRPGRVGLTVLSTVAGAGIGQMHPCGGPLSAREHEFGRGFLTVEEYEEGDIADGQSLGIDRVEGLAGEVDAHRLGRRVIPAVLER